MPCSGMVSVTVSWERFGDTLIVFSSYMSDSVLVYINSTALARYRGGRVIDNIFQCEFKGFVSSNMVLMSSLIPM